MEAQKKVDTKDLDKKVANLQKNLSFASGTDSNSLISIIHRPGWTTILDVQMAEGILEAMNQQALAMASLRNSLQQHVDAAQH